MNELSRQQHLAEQLLNTYRQVRQQCGIKRQGQSRSIERTAAAFINGRFTLAVTGEMSAGKSTFINALIEREILPTGHFQTTSVITQIEAGDRDCLIITYGDGHKCTFTDATKFAEVLRYAVALEEEYNELPIRHINNAIVAGDTPAQIMVKKSGLERASGRKIEAVKLKKYLETHRRGEIAVRAELILRLSEGLHGWRILDTPGIGAVGGIQDATKQMLFARGDDGEPAVDALVMLLNGAGNIEGEGPKAFADMLREHLGQLLDGRMFVAVTKAGSLEFRNHKDGILSRVSNLYAQALNVPAQRLTYVDSLIHRFRVEAAQSGLDLTERASWRNRLPGWAEDQWKMISDLRSQVEDEVDAQDAEPSNDACLQILAKMDNFDSLLESLAAFLLQARQRRLDGLAQAVALEISDYLADQKSNRASVSNGLSDLVERQQEITRQSQALNKALEQLHHDYGPGEVLKRFDFVDTGIAGMSSYSHIAQIRVAYNQLIQRVKDEQHKMYASLKKQYTDYARGLSVPEAAMRAIDLDDLEQQALEAASEELDHPTQKLVREGGWSRDAEYETEHHYSTVVDEDKRLREFAALAIKQGRLAYEDYKAELTTGICNTLAGIAKAIKKSADERRADLGALKALSTDRKKALGIIDNNVKSLETAAQEVQRFVNEYKNPE